MKNFKNKLANLFLILSLFVVVFGSGYKLGQSTSRINLENLTRSTNQQNPTDFNLFLMSWIK